jgi:hypothetical protein
MCVHEKNFKHVHTIKASMIDCWLLKTNYRSGAKCAYTDNIYKSFLSLFLPSLLLLFAFSPCRLLMMLTRCYRAKHITNRRNRKIEREQNEGKEIIIKQSRADMPRTENFLPSLYERKRGGGGGWLDDIALLMRFFA